MELPYERVGPYIRALRAALDALAPNEDHVSLSGALDHLYALDPACSGRLLLPAEVSARTGMPSYSWLERARSESVLAKRGRDRDDPTNGDLRRATDLDADLGARMRDRRALHRHLRQGELLPGTRLVGAIRRVGDNGWTQVALAYDRMAPDGRWVRVRAELRTPGPPQGALRLDGRGRLVIDDALQHLFTRHFATGLLALRTQLSDAVACDVLRIGRGWTGPFWYPGIALPADVPAALGSGLLLHASIEVVAEDVHESRHLDPWESAPHEALPTGHRSFRERRFAASGAALEAVQAWTEAKGYRNLVVPIQLTSRPRTL